MATVTSSGWAAVSATEPLVPFTYNTQPVGDNHILIQVTHCGICHSDLHQIKNEWSNSKYPIVPGHEIVGEVTQVGKSVTKFKVGDRAAVGCYVQVCDSCDACKSKSEQYCNKIVFTYNSVFPDGTPTYGGYGNRLSVEERYACTLPSSLSSAEAAPLLCAGITLYSPMVHFGLKAGMKLGILGLGGLGHMGVKFGKAFGCEVTVFSTSRSKEAEAKEVLGADHFVLSSDESGLKPLARKFDMLINTISGAAVDFSKFLPLLKFDGKIVFVGVSPEPHQISLGLLINRRIAVTGSLIGSVEECQSMLEFCAEKKIVPMIEVLPIKEVNTALSRLEKNDVHYRFVLEHEK